MRFRGNAYFEKTNYCVDSKVILVLVTIPRTLPSYSYGLMNKILKNKLQCWNLVLVTKPRILPSYSYGLMNKIHKNKLQCRNLVLVTKHFHLTLIAWWKKCTFSFISKLHFSNNNFTTTQSLHGTYYSDICCEYLPKILAKARRNSMAELSTPAKVKIVISQRFRLNI